MNIREVALIKSSLLFSFNAPINVKPEGGGGQATQGNLTVMYIPRVPGWGFCHLIFQLQKAEKK